MEDTVERLIAALKSKQEILGAELDSHYGKKTEELRCMTSSLGQKKSLIERNFTLLSALLESIPPPIL